MTPIGLRDESEVSPGSAGDLKEEEGGRGWMALAGGGVGARVGG